MDKSDTPSAKRERRAGSLEPEGSERLPAWVGRQPPLTARCAECGSSELSNVPAFSLGSGTAYRPVADDVYCRRCGHMGPPK